MAQVKLRNTANGPRGFYDARGECIVIPAGESVTADMSDETLATAINYGAFEADIDDGVDAEEAERLAAQAEADRLAAEELAAKEAAAEKQAAENKKAGNKKA